MWLFFSYTIQLITIKPCTKFQNPNPSSCWEIFDKKKSLQTNRQTDKQTNIITEKAKTIYPLYTSYRGYNRENWNLKHYFLLKYLTTFVCSSADNLEVNYTVHFILISYVYTFHILSKEQHSKCQRTVFNVSGHVTLILFTSILYLYMQTSTCIMKLWQCLNVTQCDEWIWKNQGRL